ncbi:Isoleucine--tRNA ligase, cytoplasmic [Orchesella cincta]|uniref:Isoleucine--tRNA ligase, cytoplasmic n=1 Tax=Orchesella cincta TaxID=48709 RepID=A0A1D2N516_ORCCI|nr:Isoleucine--tRNA ligase, cytoplasmic [Orchesella cincta]
MGDIEHVPENINFPKEEEVVMDHWKKIDAFHSCLKQSKGKPRYSFYDGPPFATGLPHYGHILAGTIKDVVTRYAHQSGFHVERRFGWDCHGLPVEYEIDKQLGITGPEDVAKMGIKAYNDECRKIVMRYSGEWETIIGRLGRWIDFKNDYKTMYSSYMESLWWVFKEMWNKGLVYRGHLVMPYSTACCTPLSNFEVQQNYKDVVDPAVVVSFPMKSKPGVSLLAWTTTPWTLPSNVALCVHPEYEYVIVEEVATGNKYVLMEARLDILYKKPEEYKVLDKFPGAKLKGEEYEPLFDYFIQVKERGGFRVQVDTYVTQDSGTGIVHQAPYFGADDLRVCKAAGIVGTDTPPICPVDAKGRFVMPVKDFVGQYVKDADKNITAMLKKMGRLIQSATIKHSYPFCWRSDTPLIYKGVPSWFIRVEDYRNDLLKNNQSTYWVPDFVKEKRFGNWLRDARDWAFSRSRYWGTPIPIWASEDFEEVVCIGSRKELEELSGRPAPEDLHREFVDDITIPSKIPGNPPLRRIPEVFDCWFESGSMPYAQNHYPFERKKEFDETFPADFIAEGVDQTRGWFYTLLVVSNHIFNKAPFKNLVVNGLVLASDGQKMSKRKKNYPDPLEIVNKYGADALRLYLINSPVVRAENLRFKEEGVRDLLKDVFLPWYNAYRFFVQNVLRVSKEDGVQLTFSATLEGSSSTDKTQWNIMDRWILSSMQSLIAWFKQEMKAYRLYTVVPVLVKFIDQLTNWYVRLNRRRLKGETGSEDCYRALEVFFLVLLSLTRLMAPFTPFITEHIYQNLRRVMKKIPDTKHDESIHFLMLPDPQEWLIDQEIEQAVEGMQKVIELGRQARDRRVVPIKFPLPEVIVVHSSEPFLSQIKGLENYVLDELNVRKLTLCNNKAQFDVHLKAQPNHQILGAKYKADFKNIANAIKSLTDAQIEECLEKKGVEVCGHWIGSDEMFITYDVGGGGAKDLEAACDGPILTILNTKADQSMLDEGVAREVINRIQKLRKKAGLVPTDDITVYLEATKDLNRIADEFKDYIQTAVKATVKKLKEVTKGINFLIEEEFQIKDSKLKVAIFKVESPEEAARRAQSTPYCKYINVALNETLKPGYEDRGRKGTILLENPVGKRLLTVDELKSEVEALFAMYGKQFRLSDDMGKDISAINADSLNRSTIYVCGVEDKKPAKTVENGPFTRFLNVEKAGKKATVLLENPIGQSLFKSNDDAKQFVESLL